jgi:hypothetical protein
MQAVAHNPAFAKKAGVPQSVGKEFMKKPKKFDAGGVAEYMSGAGIAPLQKSMAPLTKMAGAGGTQGMGQGMQRPGGGMRGMRQGMQRPGGMGRFFGRQNAMQQAQQAQQAAPQADNDVAAFNAGAAGRTAASRQAQMAELMKSQGAAPGGMPSSKGLGGLFGRRMAMQAAPTEAPPGQDLSGFSGVTGGKAGGKVSNKSVGGNKGSKMKDSKAMIGKELAFMKAKGAPKKMIKHEAAEMGVKKYARGGGIERKGKTRGKMC